MPKNILVIDDDKNICEVIKLYLQKEGYKVTVAYDGQAGLDEFLRETPELVVLDIMMPKKDGWEVLKQIRKTSSVPVIMLTAKGETFDKVLGLELGATHIAGISGHDCASFPASARRASRSLRRALCSCDLLLPIEHSSIAAISLCS